MGRSASTSRLTDPSRPDNTDDRREAQGTANLAPNHPTSKMQEPASNSGLLASTLFIPRVFPGATKCPAPPWVPGYSSHEQARPSF